MGIVIVIAFAVCGCWLLFATCRQLLLRSAPIVLWFVFGVLLILGIAVGYSFALEFEYNLTAYYRLEGFPFPLGGFHLENGQWIAFAMPKYFAHLTAITNIVVVTALSVSPVLIASKLFGNDKVSAKDKER